MTEPIRRLSAAEVSALYEDSAYMEAYRRHTDIRVQIDPHAAVGSMWEEIGSLQFQYLVSRGLRPHHTFLDFGCGTLRGGRHFIRYLEPIKYAGIDISSEAIRYARALVKEEALADRQPELVLDHSLTLDFPGLNQRFDYILAQSVFTHLPDDLILACFRNIRRLMSDTSQFFFTYAESETPVRRTAKDFSYPFSTFERVAGPLGFRLERLTDYDHPRDQVMARAMLAGRGEPYRSSRP